MEACQRICMLICPCHMQVLHICLPCRMREYINHSTIDRARTAAAARNEHRLFPGRKPKDPCPLLPGRCTHLSANGIPRDKGFLLREHPRRILHTNGDCRCKSSKNPVRHTRKNVLLLHQSRHTCKTCCKKNRPCNIAACSNGDMGAKRPHDATRLPYGIQCPPCTKNIRKRQPPLESGKLHRCKVNALTWDNICLQPMWRTHVENFRR